MNLPAMGLKLFKLMLRIRDKAVTLLIGPGFKAFGSRSVIALPFRSGNESRIAVGSGVFIGHNCWFEVMGDHGRGNDPIIRIGDNVSFSGFCTITAVSKVIIGNGALIARFVHISDHSHRMSDRETSIKDQGITKGESVHIGEGAWLGHGVIICPGVTIGRNAVVGANSVVKESVPDFCVAAGAPARIIRRKSSSPALIQ